MTFDSKKLFALGAGGTLWVLVLGVLFFLAHPAFLVAGLAYIGTSGQTLVSVVMGIVYGVLSLLGWMAISFFVLLAIDPGRRKVSP